MTDIPKLAAGLSEAEREWLLHPGRVDIEESVEIAEPSPEWDRCAELSLSHYWDDQLTSLGMSVRDHLIAQGEGQ